ncbi:MAG: hypothetical protein ACI87J_002475 [Colwellia sp.]|jgi:hypothetical protein
MNREEFEYLNTLSIKGIKDTLTSSELNEFKRLLTLWNDNLFESSYIANAMV